MPTPTYTPLATVTLGSSASSVTFSSIPATYRDLILVTSHSMSAVAGMRIRLNGDTGNNYNFVRAHGSGSVAESDGASNFSSFALQLVDYSASTVLPFVLQFMDYSATDKHKTMLARPNSSANSVGMEAHRWANTSAVTSILVYLNTGNYSTGSTFALYGIAS